MDEPKTCAYCEEPIADNDPAYVTKWFPDRQLMLPVHEYHLRINRKKPEPEKQLKSWWEHHQPENEFLGPFDNDSNTMERG